MTDSIVVLWCYVISAFCVHCRT